MAVRSMTGFARADGAAGPSRWSWEVKTVNGKGLDVRLRLPPGHDALEGPARAAVGARFARGSCQIGLSVSRDSQATRIRVNHDVLDAVLAAMAEAGRRIDAVAPRLDGLFAIKGVLETEEPEESEDERSERQASMLVDLERALDACAAMRASEGAVIGSVLSARVDEMESLTGEAEANPARQPAAIRNKLETQLRLLLDAAPALDPDRLHQEAVLLASKVDIREELDRLAAHVAMARRLLAEGGTIGRKLDFLAQELNREVNTLCSKSNDVRLTETGLRLKTVVEQFREQVQNIE
jgi:uncharacterized protein (TIGR00255 family)